MYVQRFDPGQLACVYNIRCVGISPWKGVTEPPFGAAWAVVEPGGRTKRHGHQDGEMFLVVRGRGEIDVGGETARLEAGDAIYLPPFDEHTLRNTTPDEELVFISAYWEDRATWTQRTAPRPRAPEGRVMVTAAPPTPNGDLHVGHLSGPYLAADIHARYLRASGVDAAFVCGTDDNQSYVRTKAEQIGLPPQETADRMTRAIEATLAAARAEIELFVRPNGAPTYARIVHDFFRTLYDRGKLVVRETPCPYCETCRAFLFEAHIRGRCPHCGDGTGGNSCEGCGRPNDCADLLEPACARCGAAPSLRACRRIVFPLGDYTDMLRDFHRTTTMNARLRSLCEHVLDAGLPDIAITHPADWGLSVPLEGFEAQRLFAWFEMAPRYLAYAEALAEKRGVAGGWPWIWKADGAAVVQCFGTDNGFYYAVLVPALLRAFDPALRLPSAYLMNQFYRLDGLKFSTSRGHAIWGRELLAKAPPDAVRFHLAWTCPEVEGTNFTLEDFAATASRELFAPAGAWLRDIGARVAREADGVAPAPGDWIGDHRLFYERLTALIAEAATAYEARTFSPQRAARALRELVREGHRFGKSEEGWTRVETRAEERRTALALELLAAKSFAITAFPLVPDLADRVFRALGFGTPLSGQAWEPQPLWVPEGQRIGDLAAAVAAPDLGRITPS